MTSTLLYQNLKKSTIQGIKHKTVEKPLENKNLSMDMTNTSKVSFQSTDRYQITSYMNHSKNATTVYKSFASKLRQEVDLSGEKSLIKDQISSFLLNSEKMSSRRLETSNT